MALWRLTKLFVAAAAFVLSVQAQSNTSTTESNQRRLWASAPGNIAACYTPFHNNEYPLFGGSVNVDALRNAIDEDFRFLSQYVTFIRTYYAQHFGIEMAPIAAKYGLKLYLGAYLTSESWWNDEANAAANAIKNYPGTVLAVMVGSENLAGFYQRSWDIINKIKDIKNRAGDAAGNVMYGTAQRINEFVDSRFDWDMQQLNNYLDILGVNIYPFFTDSYDVNQPTALLDAEWNQVVNKYPRGKILLTETGYPTAGHPSSEAPHVYPGLDASIGYYQGVVGWTPNGYDGKPKFWFQAFDRRYGDPAAGGKDFELYFGFFTTQRGIKRDGFPRHVTDGAQARSAPSGPCTIEEGVDYTGNDIGNKPAGAAEDCFALCDAFSGCGAFTWNLFNGGTCWLKSGKGNTAPNKNARSGLACTPSPRCNIIAEGVDYSGNDIGNQQAGHADSCFTICKYWGGCAAFTWNDFNGGTCWLKSSVGPPTNKPGARSGFLCPDLTCSIDDNTDYSGTDVGNRPASRAEDCFGLCDSISACGAFTWTNFNGGTCWLKSYKGSSKSSSGARSGVGGLEPNVDYSGNDLSSVAGANAEACVSSCQSTSGCHAFTWTSYSGGTCWLKSGKGDANYNPGSTSGIIC